MTNFYKLIFSFIIVLIICSCSSNDNCVKTITIPQFYFINNQSYSYDITQEVSCDVQEVTEPLNIAPPKLKNFSYEILVFEYTSDTGNNTTRLQIEVKLINSNNFTVKGFPYFTIKTDDLVFSTNYYSLATTPCLELNANSNCVFNLDIEESLDLGMLNNPQLINVEYVLTN